MALQFHGLTVLLLLIASASVLSAAPPSELPLTQYVNPFIGTAPGGSKFGFDGDSGDVFPGALCPRGLVQFSPDTTSNLPGGYHYPDDHIKGFSLTHFSGRGCTAYQDIPFMPVVGEISASPATRPSPYTAQFSHANETARPGYYQVRLDTGVTVELTAAPHTGLARFTFPESKTGTLLVSSGGSVNGNSDPTEIAVSGDREVSGQATGKVGCGSEKYTLYFVAEFDRPFHAYGTWSGETVSAASRTGNGPRSGAYLSFDTAQNRVVQVKAAISYVSLENARANLKSESPRWDFDAAAKTASAAWNQVLNRVQVQGGSPADLHTFYTALYHSFIHPNIFSDVNGQYLGFDAKVHTVPAGHAHYENIPGWDEYRSLLPLQSILVPDETSDVVQSLVDDAQQGGGGMPRWQQTNRNSSGMVGDSPSAIISTAYAFGVRGFDTAAALTAMEAGASDPATRSDGHVIREGLRDYLDKGYLPGTGYHSAAVTLEYGTDDFALSQFAKTLGDDKASDHYLRQAQNWKNLFDPAGGYIHPRLTDGSWLTNFDPAAEKGFVEGSSAQYTWLVPFNLHGLFAGMGGNEAAVKRLDTFFTKLNDGNRSQYAFMGNEPCEETPWEYIWAGKPSRTQAVTRRIQNELFGDQPNNFPRNDDVGAISSWYVFSAIGLYPEIPGVAGLAVGSPRFPQITLRPSNGRVITIQGQNASLTTPFVQSVQLNGKSYDSAWIPWERLQHGATLQFTLGQSASDWGEHPSDPPPSFDAAPNATTPILPVSVPAAKPPL